MGIFDKILNFINGAEVTSALSVDGIGGKATVKAMQKYFGTTQDGVLGGQNATLMKKYAPGIKSYKSGKGGSPCVKAMQKWLGITADGIWGKATSAALQKKLGVTADGIFGANSVKALQKYLNKATPTPTPKPTPTPPPSTKGDKILAACKTQADWMKSAKYGSYSPVTLAHSKSAGTCVTYEGCVFQRVGALASGKYVWQNGKGYGTGKVTGVNSKTMTVTYMGNKTLSSLKNVIQKGDCILLDDNKSGKSGSGGHVFFCTGEWSGNDPYIWDFEPNRTCAKTGKKRKYSGSRKVLARVRLIESTPTYRVRKTWADSKSQVGAYKILDNAKKECDKHAGYSVYDESGKAVYTSAPKQTIIDKELEACKVQADWMKNFTYKWQENPTIAKSKKYGTCVTYVACVLQRIGILKSGQYIWINNKKKVEGANSKMTVTYPSGTLKSNKSNLKKGDIVIGGNGKTGAGAGSHIFILTGKWDGDNPYIYDQDSATRVKKGKAPEHPWKGSFKMIALIRLK